MRPHSVLLFCVIALTTGALTPSPADPGHARKPPPPQERSAHAVLMAAYDRINDAGRRHDLNCVMSYFTPDYDEVDAQGVISSRDRMRSQYQDWLGRIHTMQGRYVIQSVAAAAGGGLLAQVSVHVDGTGERRVLLARIQGSFTNDFVVRDLWVRTPGGWRIRHRQTLTSETHMRPR